MKNKEKWVVYSLVSVFFILVFIFGGVVFYSDMIYPQKFKTEFCDQKMIGQKKSALEVIRWWGRSRVHKDQFYVKASESSDSKPIDSQMASMMFEKSSYGDSLWVGARLGLVMGHGCEVLIENNEIQKIISK